MPELFMVGERVLIAPDFSNDGFEPFEAIITEVIDGTMVMAVDDDGTNQPWMNGNVTKLPGEPS